MESEKKRILTSGKGAKPVPEAKGCICAVNSAVLSSERFYRNQATGTDGVPDRT